MTCAHCGGQTPNRVCRSCQRAARAEERARQREYDDEKDEVRTDGGGFSITLDRTHVRDGDDIEEIWKATVDNADAYEEMGGRTPGRALRALAREFDDVFGDEPRTDGGGRAFAPTDDTPLSYQMRCGVCESIIGMSARFCKHCGAKVDHTEGNEDAATRRLLTGGDR